MTKTKIATATRKDGNVYGVTYQGRSAMDRDVPYSYLQLLVREGLRVEVDQAGHRGEGEPKRYTLARGL